jgi:hypothetical protein
LSPSEKIERELKRIAAARAHREAGIPADLEREAATCGLRAVAGEGFVRWEWFDGKPILEEGMPSDWHGSFERAFAMATNIMGVEDSEEASEEGKEDERK